MRIIGLMGAIGCGKGTVAEILIDSFDFKSITIGDLVRDEVKKRGLPLGRDNETKVSVELRINDPAYFIKQAVKKINESGWDKVVIDGIRLPLDVETLKKSFNGMVFVLVKADPKLRYERMKTRGRASFPDNYDKFLKEEQLEVDKFNLNETWKSASVVINNDSGLEEIRMQVIEMLEELDWL